MADLKKAHESKDIPAIDTAMEKINAVWASASEDLYKSGQTAEGVNPGAQAGGEGSSAGSNQGGDNVEDVDFEEVK